LRLFLSAAWRPPLLSLSSFITWCWFVYIGSVPQGFGCIHGCFHSHSHQIFCMHGILTYAMQFLLFPFACAQGVFESGIYMCSRLVSTEGVHQPCSLSFYVQQISFHVESLLLCFLSFSCRSASMQGLHLESLGQMCHMVQSCMQT
jgi:hypothetical protein